MAVSPDESTRSRLSALDLGSAEGLRVVRPEQLHITLRFLGQVDDDRVPELSDALGRAAASVHDVVRCRLGPSTAWFGGDRVLQIPVEGLDELAGAVRLATLAAVPDAGDREPAFQGHLTVARSNGRRDGASERHSLAGIPFAGAFEVSSLDLVASRLTDDGPRYSPLASSGLPE
ncbi:MAG TPA: RNA 2',3'-cyclic phosphodiesterase [Acidimicrobiales bacterium]|nr:RNA 2',3'-cyclic phosphodiesterase [Acidimicrobiales bacterium]